MLCQFSFKNFKSYRDETVFDMQAADLSEFADSIIECSKASRLLPVASIYGPNGGGKSNLLQALACLVSTVVHPIHELQKTRTGIIVQQRVSCNPFLLDNSSRNEPTEFLLYFRINSYEYRYYLSLQNDEIVSEILDRKKIGGKRMAHLFSREGKDIKLGSSINKVSINRTVNPKMPYLSFLAINYDLEAINDAQKWFESCIIQNYGNPVTELYMMLSDNLAIRERIIRVLNDMDIDISGYRYDDDQKQLVFQRNINGNKYELPYEDESDGTKKMIVVIPFILMALKEGRLLIVDALDAKLHPKLLRYIISIFKDKNINKYGAQLVFTSHDIITMRSTVYRRDEIWFAAENECHESELYSLYDIKNEHDDGVRRKAKYDVEYLECRYGADPYLNNMFKVGGW